METDGSRQFAWVEGDVDPSEEHMELRHGSAYSGGWPDWTPVARVAAPHDRRFRVEFLLDPSDSMGSDARTAAERELTFYLVDKEEPDPWGYAKYHCTTASNVYSSIYNGGRATLTG